MQHRGWISRIHLRTVSTTLAFLIVLGLGMVATQSARAQTFSDLYGFTAVPDGEYPYAGLVRNEALYSVQRTCRIAGIWLKILE
jgi:hypothetical protein